MAVLQLNIIKPSVNNMTVRVFLRAAGLDFTENDVFGQTRSPEFLAKDPAHLTPMIEAEDLPNGTLWESCAIMQYLCNKHGLDKLYPRDPEARAMTDSAMFYLIGTFYPLSGAGHLSRARLPAVPGRSRRDRRRCGQEGRGAEGFRRRTRRAARSVPLVLYGRKTLHRR